MIKVSASIQIFLYLVTVYYQISPTFHHLAFSYYFPDIIQSLKN